MTCPICGTLCLLGAGTCAVCNSSLSAPTWSLPYTVSPETLLSAARGTFAFGSSAPEALPYRYRLPHTMARTNGRSNLLTPGTMLNNRYQIEQLLGSGSFGRVYLACDTATADRDFVAIKEMPAHHFQDETERSEAVTWFQREVSVLLRLHHAAIPAIHGYWSTTGSDPTLYLVMDYIPGPTMDQILDQAAAPLPWQTVLTWGIALCDVLTYLHEQSPALVYRDLKPSNVLLDSRTGSPVLIDFGIARQLATPGGTIIGTWGYVPYEQILGKTVPASDQYALGALLHTLLTRRRPDNEFSRLQRQGLDLEATLRDIFPPVTSLNPHVPSTVAAAIARATAFSPADRFPSTAALASVLSAILQAPTMPALAPVLQSRDEPAGSAILSVSPDGECEYRSIGAAICQAPPGARIKVHPGLYHESVVIDRPLEIVCAGPAGSVIVEATGEPCLVMHARAATVRGLVLRAGPRQGRKDRYVVDIPTGRLVLEDCRISSAGLACIAVHGPHARPVIRGCIIERGREAGVLFADMSEGVLEDCAITRCGTGIIIRRYAGPNIRRCTIQDAVSYGIHADAYAEGVVEACLIQGNGHAGVCIDHGSMLAVRDCTIRRNERAVGVAADGGGVIERCDLSGNLLGAWSILPGADLLLRRSFNTV